MTKQLSGPANFESWRACWRVFRTAMILLGACLPGPLDEYEENIRVLSTGCGPRIWGMLSHADEIMRSARSECPICCKAARECCGFGVET